MADPLISITTKIDKEDLGNGLHATVLSGVIDIRQYAEINGRNFFVEKVLPFSYIGVVEEIVDAQSAKRSKDLKTRS